MCIRDRYWFTTPFLQTLLGVCACMPTVVRGFSPRFAGSVLDHSGAVAASQTVLAAARHSGGGGGDVVAFHRVYYGIACDITIHRDNKVRQG